MASARSIIPGLSVCPVDEEFGEGLEIPTLQKPIVIPESQRFGNCRSLEQFEKLRAISMEDSESAYECRDKEKKRICVLKKLRRPYENGFPLSYLREISLLKTLNHNNIICFYGVAVGKSLDSNYLILENWVCSLENIIEKDINAIYNEPMVKCLMQQLFAGIDHIHKFLVVHRNINCENIIFTEAGNLKITGFSFSRFFSKGDETPKVTNLKYRAPEQMLNAKYYSPASDMWSAGCVFARLILKDFLFEGSTELEMLKSIAKVLGSPSEKIWAGCSKLLFDMMPIKYVFTEEIPYSYMNNIFSDHSPSLQNLLQDLLIYDQTKRPHATVCLTSSYFIEEPCACSPEAITPMLRAFVAKTSSTVAESEFSKLVNMFIEKARNDAS